MSLATAADRLPRTASPGRTPAIALDAFNALVASIQTGFGPFVAVYLASEAWTQRDIGVMLSIGTITGMIFQLPGGAAVDALRNKRLAALVSCMAVAVAALLLILVPSRPGVLAAEILHGFASCMLGPAIAAVSLHLVGRAGLGERLGRNGRWAAIGSAAAAAVMGASGSAFGEASVFWLTAALMLPAAIALHFVRLPGDHPEPPPKQKTAAWRMILDPKLLVFALAVLLFTVGNAAILPQVGESLTRQIGSRASLVIAACIVVPQVLVAFLSPTAGRLADRLGRRPVLIVAFAALPLRAVLLSVIHEPWAIVLIQLLDGLSGAGLGVLIPLVAADLTRGTGRFTLCMGAIGLAAGIGGTISTTLGGVLAQSMGPSTSLLALGAVGGLATLAILLFQRETRPASLDEATPHPM